MFINVIRNRRRMAAQHDAHRKSTPEPRAPTALRRWRVSNEQVSKEDGAANERPCLKHLARRNLGRSFTVAAVMLQRRSRKNSAATRAPGGGQGAGGNSCLALHSPISGLGTAALGSPLMNLNNSTTSFIACPHAYVSSSLRRQMSQPEQAAMQTSCTKYSISQFVLLQHRWINAI